MKKIKRLLSYLLTAMVIVTAITSTGVVAHASMLPLEEVKAYLVLNGYSKEDLSAMSVDKMIDMLEDSDGNKIEIASDATTVWKYLKEGDNGVEVYETHTIGADSEDNKINLYPGDGVDTFQFEFIIGKDGQLSSGNKRYIVIAYFLDDFDNDIEPQIYIQSDDNVREEAVPDDCKYWTFDYSDGSEELVYDLSFSKSIVGSLADHGSVWLNFKSKLTENPRVKIEVYPVLIYDTDYGTIYATVKKPIADQILNQNMEKVDAGYQISGEKNTDETFQIVTYVDGEEYSKKYLCVRYWNWYPCHEGDMFTKEGNNRVSVFSDIETNFDAKNHVNNITFELKAEYSENAEYYFDYNLVMQKNFGSTADKTNYDGLVNKIVVGHYDSIEEAEADGAKDVTSDVLHNGYLADYSGDGMKFTVFKNYRMSQSFPLVYDTLADKITVKVKNNADSWRKFTDKPIIGEVDPWFRVLGATDSNGNLYCTENNNAYIVENGKNINMDTYYGYGYQTVFIYDENKDIDLSKLQPNFEYADKDRLTAYEVSKDSGNKVEEDHTRDFSEENQQYTLVFDDNENQKRNYWITYKQLNNNGPELYVLGPQEREVIFDDYFGDKHDILIANVGNAPLTNLSVELRDAENVKLDSYWTVGGENNETLAPFTTTSADKEYGELPNMGKIRLVPDGNGEVKGTVVIKAGEVGNEQEVAISLNGTVKTPEIITDTLSDAVKYVPYQYIIATDNIHDNIREEFEIVEGEQALPMGLEFNKNTGEISGVPQVPDNNAEYEDYEFTVKVNYFNEGENEPFDSVSKKFKLRVNSNTNDNVYNASDEGYTIKEHIGTETENSHEFVLENTEEDQLFVSNGSYGEFVDLWLNGEKLYYDENDLENSDYTKEEGSTRITIKSETFENKANTDKPNTIAMEFRNDDNEVNRTAQNFNIKNTPSSDKAVENVISLINAIPSNVTLDDKAIVQKARNAYNALSSTQKNSVTNYSKLTDAESVISKLESDEANKAAANKVIALINSLPNSISISDKSTVETARSAYDALTSVQKGYVSNYNKLIAAEEAINTLEKNRAVAQPVINLINDIPTSITLDCKDEVTAARNAYNKLTSEQKEYVTNYKKLQAAEDAIETLEAEEQERAKDRAAAQPVIDLINAIPSTVTLESEDAITSARNAYNLLLSNQKGYVTNYQNLTEAEDKLAELKKETDGKTVNMVCYVVDKNGKALVDYLVEIHSDVQQSRTDENGFARFSNVEMTNHTIIIKNAEGKELSNKSFKITEGNLLSLTGDEIVAQAGSTFTLAIKADEESINFLNVESGDKAPELENKDDKPLSIDISDSTKDEKNIDDITIDISDSTNGGTSANTSSDSVATGDRNTMYAWYVLLVCSWATLVVMFIRYRRKRNN